jgi:radial spoke head protein 4A
MAARDFEDAKAYLQRSEGGTSVYDHVSALVLQLLTTRPEGALSQLEHLSGLLKEGAYPEQRPAERASGSSEAEYERAAGLERARALAKLFAAPAEGDEAGEVGEGLQSVADVAPYLEWGGVSLGREETFRAFLALKQLSASTGAREVRLWGKLLGREGDYWVAEGKADAPEDEAEAKDALGHAVEATGTGANTYSYWVCAWPGAPWVRLPRVTPHQVLVARKVRRFLTGRLDARVGGHPPFPGQEASLVRALIAIISADTVLAPSGFYRTPEGADEGSQEVEPVPPEEYSPPDLTAADGWVHLHLKLNAIGRTAPDPKDDDAAADGDAAEPEPGTEASVPLQSIAEDAEEGEEAAPWGFRACPVSGVPEPEPGVVVARSLKWPGAIAVGYGRRFANVYVGYGIARAKAPFQPTLPPAVAAEFSVAAFNPAAEDAVFAEQKDVIVDPDLNKPKPAEGEEEGGAGDE